MSNPLKPRLKILSVMKIAVTTQEECRGAGVLNTATTKINEHRITTRKINETFIKTVLTERI